MKFRDVTFHTDDIRFFIKSPDWLMNQNSGFVISFPDPVRQEISDDNHQSQSKKPGQSQSQKPGQNQGQNQIQNRNQNQSQIQNQSQSQSQKPGQNQNQNQNHGQNHGQNSTTHEGEYLTDRIAHQSPNSEPLFTVKTGNQWIAEAQGRPDPVQLWDEFWHEGEVSCLFADSNLGKSIYAVQIAEAVAQSRRVIYFDFELSDKQFQQRYTDENGRRHHFSPNMLRAEIDTHQLTGEDEDVENFIIDQIENTCVANDVKIVIIDNISFLCNSADKGYSAGSLMMRLLDLKRHMGLSILVLAHTPKRLLSNPITQNDLAGSKKIFNFSDSVFAIGKSSRDEDLRYIKQIKVRAGKFRYDSENVIVAEIVKENAFLHFKYLRYATEREHLRENKEDKDAELQRMVMEAIDEGERYEDIAGRFGISMAKVSRIKSKNRRA